MLMSVSLGWGGGGRAQRTAISGADIHLDTPLITLGRLHVARRNERYLAQVALGGRQWFRTLNDKPVFCRMRETGTPQSATSPLPFKCAEALLQINVNSKIEFVADRSEAGLCALLVLVAA